MRWNDTRSRPRPAPAPCALLPLWDVADGQIITSHGDHFAVMGLRGLDSEHTDAAGLAAAAQQLYAGLGELPAETLVQCVLVADHGGAADLELIERLPAPTDPILARQRAARLAFLRGRGLRRFRTHLAVGQRCGLGRAELGEPEPGFGARSEAAEALGAQVRGWLGRAGIESAPLPEAEIVEVFWRGLGQIGPAPRLHRTGQLFDAATRARHPTLSCRSPREQLFRASMAWSEDSVRIGARHFAVLTLRHLPPATAFTLPERVYYLPGDWRLSVNLIIPDQERVQRSFRLGRRLAHANAHREAHVADDHKLATLDEANALSTLLARTGLPLVLVGAQLVLSADSAEALAEQVEAARDYLAQADLVFFPELAAHDRELPKSLPGMAVTFDRWAMCTGANAVDLLPLFGGDAGDLGPGRAPPLVLETARGEAYGFDPVAPHRDNWNACIFGASGSGKSVFVNLLICAVLGHPRCRGRLMVVDFAGEQRSSYLMLARLLGGAFVPIVTDDAAHALNPFPPVAEAITRGDDGLGVRAAVLHRIGALTDLLLANEGPDKDAALYRGLVQRGVRETYRRFVEAGRAEAPRFSDLLETWQAMEGDAPRRATLIALLEAFLGGPYARLFDRPTATPEAPFIIFDLFGLDTLPDHVAEAVVLLVTDHLKSMAFARHDDGIKYVILDEVAQLIRRPSLAALVDELYSTARKHRTSVWTVTQQYASYTDSPLAGVVRLNTTTQIILSHQSDAGARALLADDWGLGPRERAILDRLCTVKGQYAEALLRTQGRHGPTAARLRVRLSPLDYQIATSDAADRARQRRWLAHNPSAPVIEVLERLAAANAPTDPVNPTAPRMEGDHEQH